MGKLIVVRNHYDRDRMQRGIDPKIVRFASYGQNLQGSRFDEIYVVDPGESFHDWSAEKKAWLDFLPTRLNKPGDVYWV
jgi:hypothetical protein